MPATLEMASETHLEAFSLIPLEESVEFFENLDASDREQKDDPAAEGGNERREAFTTIQSLE